MLSNALKSYFFIKWFIVTPNTTSFSNPIEQKQQHYLQNQKDSTEFDNDKDIIVCYWTQHCNEYYFSC
jgi:hypothetical protein